MSKKLCPQRELIGRNYVKTRGEGKMQRFLINISMCKQTFSSVRPTLDFERVCSTEANR